MKSKKSKTNLTGLLTRAFSLVIIVILLVAGIAKMPSNTTTDPSQLTPSATIEGATQPPPTVQFPGVPAGGVPVTADHTYFHPSARYSLPHFTGWDIAEGGEETVEPAGDSQLTRAGSTFINSTWLSVIHVFTEKDPKRTIKELKDLDGYYNQETLGEAWVNYTGGWKELSRKTVEDAFVIDFELYLNSQTYVGRQISRFNGDWLMVERLVAPGNNPQLLDQLQQAINGKFRVWTESETTPMRWGTFADYVLGYVIRYPEGWSVINGGVGAPATITGQMGTTTITLTTRVVPARKLGSEDDAKKFVQETWPNAVIKRSTQATASGATGYAVSFTSPDPDGNKLSSAATMLNGANGNLYVANLQASALDQDLLDPANSTIPLELTQIRNSFFLIPTDQLVPTPIPSITPTPLPTAVVNTPVPTVAPTAASTEAATESSAPTAAGTEGF